MNQASFLSREGRASVQDFEMPVEIREGAKTDSGRI